MKKRIVSFFLALLLVFSICPSCAFAYGMTVESATSGGSILIEEYMNISRDYLTETFVDQNGKEVFVYNVGGVICNIIVEQNTNSTTFIVTEDGVTARMSFTADNKLYLNDSYVGTVGSQNNARAAYEIYWTKQCPYGSSSDYSTYYRYEEKRNQQLNNTLIALGATLLASALIAIEPALSVISIDMMVSIASIMIDDAPYATAASFKDTIYVHNVKGYWISASIDPLGVEKHSIELFAGPSYEYPVGGNPIESFRCQDF